MSVWTKYLLSHKAKKPFPTLIVLTLQQHKCKRNSNPKAMPFSNPCDSGLYFLIMIPDYLRFVFDFLCQIQFDFIPAGRHQQWKIECTAA
jgi:hypothetical protein